jgi:hypothetical protein
MVKPRRIECGAVGAPDFRRLTWRGWGSGTARASGTVTYRDCPGPYPGCADPRNYHTVPVSLRVYRIRVCDGRRAYTRLRATLRKVDGEQSGYSLDLTVNWGHCRA